MTLCVGLRTERGLKIALLSWRWELRSVLDLAMKTDGLGSLDAGKDLWVGEHRIKEVLVRVL